MSKGKNNILVTIVLLIFVGQAMSSTSLFCDMPLDMMADVTSGQQHDMSNMNHDMNASMTSNMSDCCAGDNHCNMSSCFSLALTNDMQIEHTFFPLQTIPFNFIMAPSQTTSSLYRPPIYA